MSFALYVLGFLIMVGRISDGRSITCISHRAGWRRRYILIGFGIFTARKCNATSRSLVE